MARAVTGFVVYAVGHDKNMGDGIVQQATPKPVSRVYHVRSAAEQYLQMLMAQPSFSTDWKTAYVGTPSTGGARG